MSLLSLLSLHSITHRLGLLLPPTPDFHSTAINRKWCLKVSIADIGALSPLHFLISFLFFLVSLASLSPLVVYALIAGNAQASWWIKYSLRWMVLWCGLVHTVSPWQRCSVFHPTSDCHIGQCPKHANEQLATWTLLSGHMLFFLLAIHFLNNCSQYGSLSF